MTDKALNCSAVVETACTASVHAIHSHHMHIQCIAPAEAQFPASLRRTPANHQFT
jgi:hypothetical protein